ncbi:MAG: hypothetical protein ACLFPX_04110 [Candidatus Omnitrophota bacterium]
MKAILLRSEYSAAAGSVLKIFCCFVLFGFSLCSVVSAQELTINMVAVNASETSEKTLDINQPLPKELEPSDIVDSGALDVDYDVDNSRLYAHGQVEFEPKESKTFKIRVRDVWRINPQEIELLKQQLEKNLELMQGEENYDSAVFVADRMQESLDYILQRQNDFQGNIARRIEEYRANLKELEDIRDNVYSMDYLPYQAKSLEEEMRAEKTVKFIVEVKNPSEDEPKTVQHKHYLPEEVRADDIVDSKGFEVRFDEARGQAYLSKEEEFEPGETKRYEIMIRDIWRFPEIKVQDLMDRAQIAQLELEGTDYAESAQFLMDEINQRVSLIRDSQTQTLTTKEQIGMYRINKKRFEEAWEDFKRIEEMIAIVRAKKLQELEEKKVKNVLERLKALRGLQQLSEALFKKRISQNLTWKIIMATMAFVALFTTYHFVVWSRRSKIMGEELGPQKGEEITEVPKPGAEEEEEE